MTAAQRTLQAAFAAALLAMLAPAVAQPPAAASAPAAANAAARCPALLDHTFPRLQDETPQNLCQYRGQVVLVVNTASYCGFTPQYEGLEKLYARYAGRGFTILGFPSGDFGDQEKTSNREIAEFCFNTYGVKFPMFARSTVKGAAANPLFAALARDSGQAPRWNFHKYLIGRDGKVVAAFPSQVEPLDSRLTRQIETLLGG
jgi:glutathione peroxidase